MKPFHRLAVSAAIVLLSACSEEKAPQAPQKIDDDPALTGALADQIMVDPHLANQNRADAVIAVEGPPSAQIPTQETGPAAADAARAEAAKLAGGTIRTAPAPVGGHVASIAGAAACAGKVEYTAAWAARLPAAFPVYPRGAVQEAAGTDRDGCALRVVTYTTAVSPQDVMDFYYTRAGAARFGAEHRLDGAEHSLGGSKGKAAYLVSARARDDGLTEVDLITSG